MKIKVLLVEDDVSQRMMVSHLLERALGYEVKEAANGKEALYFLQKDDENSIDIVLTDLQMPEMDGHELLLLAKEKYPSLPIIMLTGSTEVEDAVKAIQNGAADFLPKPIEPERIAVCIRNALKVKNLSEELSRLKRTDENATKFNDLIGYDSGLKESINLGRKVANSDISVLVSGDTGVGKELFARAIHGESLRGGKPFIAVNCGAIPENLVESTLFGHEKGAFTGAIAKSIGKFREADGGTLFLDEVGELPLDTQVKLLRVLQQQEIEPVGGGKPISVNVRVISATNRNLAQEVHIGNFRQDLFFRLNIFPIVMPTLLQRKEDIKKLVEYFIERFSVSEDKPITDISDKALAALTEHHWSGNVRELENSVFRAVILCESDILQIEDFAMTFHYPQQMDEGKIHTPTQDLNSIAIFDSKGKCRNIEDIYWQIIDVVLARNDNNINKTAISLGMPASTLYRKIRERAHL